MTTAKRYMTFGAVLVGGLNLLVQGWGVAMLVGLEAVAGTGATSAMLLGVLLAQIILATAIGALTGGAIALVTGSDGRRAMALAAAAGAILALLPDVDGYLSGGSLWGPWRLLTTVPAIATYACLGAAAVGLFWYCRTHGDPSRPTQRLILGGAAIGAGINMVLQGWTIMFTPMSQDNLFDTVAPFVSQVLFAAALGAIVGALLALVGPTGGRSRMALGAALGFLAGMSPLLALFSSGVSAAALASPGYVVGMIRMAGTAGLFTAAAVATAMGFLWYVTHGAGDMEQPLPDPAEV